MTVKEALESSGIDVLDAEVLLASHMHKDRAWLLAHPTEVLPNVPGWLQWLERRKSHEPVAYITETKEFYGYDFTVNPDVLVPRPETETLVDLALDIFDINETTIRDAGGGVVAAAYIWKDLSDVHTICDVCTGSGCVAIALKRERPDLTIIATDIAKEALTVAAENAKALGVDIEFREGNLLEPLQDIEEPFLVVANPPYVPESDNLPPDVGNFEPHKALFSGPEGTDHIRRLLNACSSHKMACGIVLECRKNQLEMLSIRA